ncbi:MAG: hypothetical protein PHO56_01190 [Patescibacteria group bacterium]|nr:hypothetical protein [Patescibacteria group bacterium]
MEQKKLEKKIAAEKKSGQEKQKRPVKDFPPDKDFPLFDHWGIANRIIENFLSI